MTLRPRFRGYWHGDATAGDVYVIEIVDRPGCTGIRFTGSAVVAWLDPQAPSVQRQLQDLGAATFRGGEKIYLKLTAEGRANDAVQFFARDVTGWWHLYSQDVYPISHHDSPEPIQPISPA